MVLLISHQVLAVEEMIHTESCISYLLEHKWSLSCNQEMSVFPAPSILRVAFCARQLLQGRAGRRMVRHLVSSAMLLSYAGFSPTSCIVAYKGGIPTILRFPPRTSALRLTFWSRAVYFEIAHPNAISYADGFRY